MLLPVGAAAGSPAGDGQVAIEIPIGDDPVKIQLELPDALALRCIVEARAVPGQVLEGGEFVIVQHDGKRELGRLTGEILPASPTREVD
jgi:hypothetical protein